jgi:hypothetical protein
MMYRQLMPFVALLIAYTAGGLLLSLQVAKETRPGGPRASLRRLTASIVVAALSAGWLGWVSYRNAIRVSGEIGWGRARNAYHAEGNLVVRSLDTFYWRADTPLSRGIQALPVSGMRVSEPPAWRTDFQIIGPKESHYEIWWLESMRMKHFQLLINQSDTSLIRQHCAFYFFDGAQFRPLPEDALEAVTPFTPQPGERVPFEPYAWLRFTLKRAIQSRAVRLTCSGFEHAALRQIEIFEKEQYLSTRHR